MAAGQAWMRGKLLGAGAFGSVNLAIDRADGAVFAVKSVAVNEGSEVSVRAIENEIEMLRRLDSEYVVRCLGSDWTEEGGQVMRNAFLEYMPEGCLTDFVRQFCGAGALDEHLLRTYTRSVVEGIDYLHRQGIVHCDIKGKNILVGNGSVKLTDFGSSKRVGEAIDSDVVNCAAKVHGTPLWMAPEVVRQVEQGPASDIWSLGCTVVEMATGRAPWGKFANHFAALYHIGCTEELPEVPAWLSEEARDFLSHCFQRDPCRRWTSAQLLRHPFLTTRFVAAAAGAKAAASPASVMQFPAESDGELSASLVNSVPTLAAPSLFKRGLVSARGRAGQEGEENWASSPASPGSGPWIVVRSPKSPSCAVPFAEAETECGGASAGEGCESAGDCVAESGVVGSSAAASSCAESASRAEEAGGRPGAEACGDSGVSADGHVRDVAISGAGVSAAAAVAAGAGWWEGGEGRGKSGWNVGSSSEHWEHGCFEQCWNPQVLLYWWPDGLSRKGASDSGMDFEDLKSGRSEQCMLRSEDEYTMKLEVRNKSHSQFGKPLGVLVQV